MAALLTAIGLTEIYRLNPDDAFRQGLWIVIGVALFALTLIVLRRDYRVLESYKYLFGIGAIVLLVLPALPGIGRTINGARLWVQRRPAPVPAGRAREDLPDRLPRRLPAREARGARAGPAEGLRPAAPDLGRRDARPRRRRTTSAAALLYFGIFLAMLYVATGAARLRRRRARRSSSRRGGRLPGTSRTCRTA